MTTQARGDQRRYRDAGFLFVTAGLGSASATALAFAGVVAFVALRGTGLTVRLEVVVRAGDFVVWVASFGATAAFALVAVVAGAPGFFGSILPGCWGGFGAGAPSFAAGVAVRSCTTGRAGLFAGGMTGLLLWLIAGGFGAGAPDFAFTFVATRDLGEGGGFSARGFDGAVSMPSCGAVAAGDPESPAVAPGSEATCEGALFGCCGYASKSTVEIATPVAIAESPTIFQRRGTRGGSVGAASAAPCGLGETGGGSGETIEVESGPLEAVRRQRRCGVMREIARAGARSKTGGGMGVLDVAIGILKKRSGSTAAGTDAMDALPAADRAGMGRGGAISSMSSSICGSSHALSTVERSGGNLPDTTPQLCAHPSRSVNNYLHRLVRLFRRAT
ncbi:MAG TPA: hypothetical protein VHN14_29335 [Kofleriaceae bacterium]|nr:hypothetical protein [Kofleriaceae bacterium]